MLVFYTTSMKQFAELPDVDIAPKGTILVISPWNFPCAILLVVLWQDWQEEIL